MSAVVKNDPVAGESGIRPSEEGLGEFKSDLAQAGANVKNRWQMAWFLTKRFPLGMGGFAVVIVFCLVAVFAPWVAGQDPLSTNPGISLAKPSWDHLMGTDFMGRDLFARVVHGSKTSLAVGFGSTFLSVLFGVLIGLASGYIGGWFDLVVQRFIDMLQSLPTLILAMAMAAAMGPSLTNTMIAIAVPRLPRMARIMRANTLYLRELPFVDAAKAMGMGEFRIALRHILPNSLAPLIVMASTGLGGAILVEASLSFLGLGVPEPYPSWGRMLSESAAEYVRTAPWLVLFPGIAISLAVFATNLLGDTVRDLLDPRERTSN